MKAIRGHDIGEPGIITSQVITRIIDARLTIADLTDQNANVFYELAIRHAFHKPSVQIIQNGQKEPFNVHGLRSVPYSIDRIDLIDQARIDIEFHVKSALKPSYKPQSPVSQAVDLQSMSRSSNPQSRQIAELAASMERLEAMLTRNQNFGPSSYVTDTTNYFDIANTSLSTADAQALRNMYLKFGVNPNALFAANVIEVTYKDGSIRAFSGMNIGQKLKLIRDIDQDKKVSSIRAQAIPSFSGKDNAQAQATPQNG